MVYICHWNHNLGKHQNLATRAPNKIFTWGKRCLSWGCILMVAVYLINPIAISHSLWRGLDKVLRANTSDVGLIPIQPVYSNERQHKDEWLENFPSLQKLIQNKVDLQEIWQNVGLKNSVCCRQQKDLSEFGEDSWWEAFPWELSSLQPICRNSRRSNQPSKILTFSLVKLPCASPQMFLFFWCCPYKETINYIFVLFQRCVIVNTNDTMDC